ncbi:MAG: transcriptional regulator [Cyanobacteria bacterium P01_C01_bin.120]
MAENLTPGPSPKPSGQASPTQGEGEDNKPDWIQELSRQCDASSQRKVAGRLGVSPAVVNQLLKNSYPGDMVGMEARVRGEFMALVVACPVLGELSSKDCQQWQRKTFAATNPLRVQMYRACRGGCPHSSLGGG